jgi:hypothetical protein
MWTSVSPLFKGVCWGKRSGKWRAVFKGRSLGDHATEEAAARAYDNYVKDGVGPVSHPEGTSDIKGVSWNKAFGKWTAQYKGKHLGRHATEEAAAQAYNIEGSALGSSTLALSRPPETPTTATTPPPPPPSRLPAWLRLLTRTPVRVPNVPNAQAHSPRRLPRRGRRCG